MGSIQTALQFALPPLIAQEYVTEIGSSVYCRTTFDGPDTSVAGVGLVLSFRSDGRNRAPVSGNPDCVQVPVGFPGSSFQVVTPFGPVPSGSALTGCSAVPGMYKLTSAKTSEQ